MDCSSEAFDGRPFLFDLNLRPEDEIDPGDSNDIVRGGVENPENVYHVHNQNVGNRSSLPRYTRDEDLVVDFRDLKFKSHDQAKEYYHQYGRKWGFPTKMASSSQLSSGNHHIDGLKNYGVLACSKTGYKINSKYDPYREAILAQMDPSRVHREVKVGCPALMRFKLNEANDAYTVYFWELRHNHVLLHPKEMQFTLDNRRISETQKLMALCHERAGVGVGPSYEIILQQCGGCDNVGFLPSDLANFVRKVRRERLSSGDANMLLEFFLTQKSHDKEFFFEFKLDDESKIESFFWADSRMRLDYQLFGDSISFDTTYRTNASYRPLGCFAGFNHHRRLIIFGAALLYEETTESFKWLFTSFLKCMNQKHPHAIFSDQCPAIGAAIRAVMPEIFHGLCTFHLNENAADHFKNFGRKKELKRELNYLMYQVETPTQFDFHWQEMINELFPNRAHESHHWLDNLYDIRHKWSKPWVDQQFTCGMRSSQLSETLNSNLRKFLGSHDNLHQFLMQFYRLVSRKRHKELQCDANEKLKRPPIKNDKLKFLLQAAEVYTHDVFMCFQAEWDAGSAYWPDKEHMVLLDNGLHAMDLFYMDDDGVTRLDERMVIVDKVQRKYKCPCRLFETSGWYCRHIIRTIDLLGARADYGALQLPQEAFLKRWSKDARADFDYHNMGIQPFQIGPQVARYLELCAMLMPIALDASEDVEAGKLLEDVLNDVGPRIRALLEERRATRQQECSSNLNDLLEGYEGPIPTGIKFKKKKSKANARLMKISKKHRDRVHKQHLARRAAAQATQNLAR